MPDPTFYWYQTTNQPKDDTMIIASNYLELQSAVEEYADNVGTNPDLVAACDDQPPEGREA